MPEERNKFALRITPEMQEQIKAAYPRDNCSSQNEFIEKAIQFYLDYLAIQDTSSLLNAMLTSTLRGIMDDSENHIVRVLFKLAVEVDILMNVLAASVDVDAASLHKLRSRCINDVRQTHGILTFDDAVRFQSQSGVNG